MPGTSKVFSVSSVSESICAEVMTCAVEVTEKVNTNVIAVIIKESFFMNVSFSALVLCSNVNLLPDSDYCWLLYTQKNPPDTSGGQNKNIIDSYSTKIPLACMVISFLGCVMASISALLFPASSA